MWEKVRIIFTIAELRQKILFTLGLLLVYRIGWQIPLPLVDQTRMAAQSSQGGGLGDVLAQVTMFSASSLSQVTIFGLGIMPYISASIIFQLLGSVWKPLEELQKEGESGRKKINEYTRYATVVLCLLQSWIYLKTYVMARAEGGGPPPLIKDEVWAMMDGSMAGMFFWQLAAVLTMTTGTVFLMWLGEQIDEYGIGNGISILIMAGIVAQMPAALWELIVGIKFSLGGDGGIQTLIVLIGVFVAVIVGVVFITQGQRRIPTQSAKHVRGRRQVGGTRQYLPLKVNQAGVMPIIFASSLLMVPMILFTQLSQSFNSDVLRMLASVFGGGASFVYNLCYVGLIYFFCYFWTAITFNPKDIADNLKQYGSFIPGYRPGKRTSDYLERVMVRITYVGAGFLAVVAVIPTIVSTSLGVSPMVASFYGGTGLLIAVSVAFDLVQKIDSHLVMRNYSGLLERG